VSTRAACRGAGGAQRLLAIRVPRFPTEQRPHGRRPPRPPADAACNLQEIACTVDATSEGNSSDNRLGCSAEWLVGKSSILLEGAISATCGYGHNGHRTARRGLAATGSPANYANPPNAEHRVIRGQLKVIMPPQSS